MRILLVEDNPDLGDAIESKLRGAGHSVEWAHDGEQALAWSRNETWDAIVLDIMLPGKDGFAVIRALRAADCEAPVLVVTARSEIEDKIDMLDLGADDYMVKPFDLRELEARLRALMRRPSGLTTSIAHYGTLSLDLASRSASVADVPLDLGRREFRLLEILLSHLGKTIVKERLMNQIFSQNDDVSPNALELQISRLRKKLVDSSIDIVTIRGVGYQARNHENV